jgi:virginiamycin A acetyltransferase
MENVAKKLAKAGVHGFFLVITLPAALLSGFGRWNAGYGFFATLFAMAPGHPGDYLRISYYKWTLAHWSLSSTIQFGSFVAHPQVKVGSHVYVGSYCILGMTVIGDRTQIASGVQILSGRHQHIRDDTGRISGAEQGIFRTVTIGADCWIGAGAIVMADVGAGSTIGAGSVVNRTIPPGSLAAGSPARVIKAAAEEAGSV